MDEQGKLLVDWVGRYERLEQDFAAVCHRINVRETLPRLNVSLHGSYREHYTDRTRRLVEEAYTKDIEMFGYEF